LKTKQLAILINYHLFGICNHLFQICNHLFGKWLHLFGKWLHPIRKWLHPIGAEGLSFYQMAQKLRRGFKRRYMLLYINQTFHERP